MELKFRAWFKEKEIYIEPMTLQEMIYQKNNEFSLRQLNDWFVFEQYTGYKDYNKKEIYVGDIVDFGSGVIIIVRNSDIGNINVFTPTIIGNIHENKYLIEEGM